MITMQDGLITIVAIVSILMLARCGFKKVTENALVQCDNPKCKNLIPKEHTNCSICGARKPTGNKQAFGGDP